MISGFDHVVIAVRDITAGVAAYEALLGIPAQMDKRDGVTIATFDAPNLSVEIMSPAEDGDASARLLAALESGDGLKSLVFAARGLEGLYRRADRVGLAPEAIMDGDGYRRFRAGKAASRGLRLFFVEREHPRRAVQGAVLGIDHIVVRTPEPEHAAALYGARLALDMRLDRTLMDRRLMFFRCGDAVLEVVRVSNLVQDDLLGLSWRVADAVASRARLLALGFDVSDVRPGMKPGTSVFTVRNGTCGVPTLMLESKPRGP